MKREIAIVLTMSVGLLPIAAPGEPQPAVLALMPYMDATADCFDKAETKGAAQICVGQGATACMDAEPDGFSTVGMMFCTLAEYEAWDRLLNATYIATRDGLAREDAQEAEFFPEYAERADRLRTAQRAWIPVRDADCALEYAVWGAGSMRQIAGASCLLQKTSERTIYLRFLGAAMR